MTTFNQNPFQAPEARVDDVRENTGQTRLVAEGQNVPVGSATSWIGQGWAMFKEAPAVWIGITVIAMIISIIIAVIPIVNILNGLLGPVLMGGVMLACKAQDEGGTPTLGHIFSGFSEHFGSLIIVGLLYLGGALLIGLAIGILAGIGVINEKNPASLAVMVLLALIPFIALLMAMMFAPVLVVLQGLKPTEAMKVSFNGCLKNIGTLILYLLLVSLLIIVAAIPLLLGLLIMIPVLYGSMYAAYKDIFTTES